MPTNDDLTFTEVLSIMDEELHQAMHMAINFSNPEMAHAPGMELGWPAGVLFGMHFACQYPRLAAQLERRVFLAHPELPGPQKGADLIAEGLVDKVLRGYDTPTRADFDNRLDRLAELSEGEPTTDTPYWPLPERPHPYGGYDGIGV